MKITFTAIENMTMEELQNPEGQLQALCFRLNDKKLRESRDAFRVLVDKWMNAGSLKRMVSCDPALSMDLATAWKPYFVFTGKGAAWSVNPIPSEAKLPNTPEQWAIRHFALLVLNPICDKLGGPCDRCKRYYIKSRSTQKRFCGARCASLASAQRYTAAESKAEHKALLESAATFWPQWSERKHPNRAFWTANRVNGKRKRMNVNGTWKPIKRRITSKWISRNKAAIELEVSNRSL